MEKISVEGICRQLIKEFKELGEDRRLILHHACDSGDIYNEFLKLEEQADMGIYPEGDSLGFGQAIKLMWAFYNMDEQDSAKLARNLKGIYKWLTYLVIAPQMECHLKTNIKIREVEKAAREGRSIKW